jgi:hypothetical protein
MHYKDLLLNKPVLEPVETSIIGLAEPLHIHLFTMDDYEKVTTGGSDVEQNVIRQVLFLLGGLEADVSEEACKALGKTFAAWQIRDIYQKGLRLNGFGPEAAREALKNSERTPA